MAEVEFGVLGAVVAERGGERVALRGPRHAAVVGRLVVARRRVVPVGRLVEDLWEEPPAGAVGAVQTFVAALRKALEPDRPPRAPATLLVTEGPGYALRAAPDAVDAWRFEAAVSAAATLPPGQALERLREALGLWRGPAYAEFADARWARAERSRLAELRLQAGERAAEARLALGLAAEAVPDLDAHLAEHPWREDAWRLLALALYRTGRQGDALAVLRRARALLVGQLGVDPGPRLRRLEAEILAQDPHLDLPQAPRPEPYDAPDPDLPATAADRLWRQAAAAYDRTVGGGARARLESTVGLIRNLAVTGGGGLEAARRHRLAAIAAAEELGDPELTTRVIGGYDVPAIWTRGDDPEAAERIVAAAERTLAALPAGALPAGPPPGGASGGAAAPYDAARCRLLATIAVEMRGTRSPRGPEAAREAEETARRLDDPALLAYALNGVFMQSCTRAGLAPRRDAVGAELVALAARHGLATFEVLGHLIRMQARAALADLPAADAHAAAADRLAERHELPLVGVFTEWYAALRLAVAGRPGPAEAAYRAADARLEGAGMPGVRRGLLPLALLCLPLAEGASAGAGAGAGAWAVVAAAEQAEPGADWGPYRPWAEPFLLLRAGRRDDARDALRALPEPPADLTYEALCCLQAVLAAELGDLPALRQARARLLPAAGELAGAGTGMFTAGPVARHLAAIDAVSDG